MSQTFHGLRTAIYFVTDIVKAKNWYKDILGIEPYFDEPFYVGFNVGGYELGLHPIDKLPLTHGGVAVYWGMDDVSSTYTTLLSKGATAHESPKDVGDNIIIGSVLDPWGNIFGIIHNPHFKLEEM